MTPHPVDVRSLVCFFHGARGMRRALDAVDLTVRTGRPLALLGESGAGKTALVFSLLGLHRGVPGVVAGSASLLGAELFEGLQRLVRFEDGPTPAIRKDCLSWERALRKRLKGVLGRAVTLVPQN